MGMEWIYNLLSELGGGGHPVVGVLTIVFWFLLVLPGLSFIFWLMDQEDPDL